MSGSPIMERIKAAQAKARAASAGQDPTPTPTADISATGASAGIVPPDAPSRAQSVVTRPGDAVADPEAEKPATSEDDEESEDAAATPSPSASNVAPATVGGRRGRPSNAELAAREAAKKAEFDALVLAKAKELGGSVAEMDALKARIQTQADLLGEKDAAIARLKAAQGAPAPAPQADGLTLYVDCLPTKGDRDVTDFYEWIGPICATVAKANSVEDYRLINYTSKGLLAAAIRATIREQGLPKAITVQTFAGGADIALEVLTPLAKRVIKKV